VRVVAEVPEIDFEAVGPGTPVTVQALATRRDLRAKIARRSPQADLSTRTVHLEIDVPDPDRSLPVGTTAEVAIDVGAPVPATEIPLLAAAVRGDRATVFVVEGEIAHRRVYTVKGERTGSLFLEPLLGAGGRVVTEGRAQLQDGDRVRAVLAALAPARAGIDLVDIKR
jgi:membrane fusion protein, multidrug efflux system